jgi:tetratricopeptide (TPR) repeat protein
MPGLTDPVKALAYRYRAEARLDAGALANAIADFTEALRLKPEDAPALAGRAQARLAAGDLGAALTDFDAAIARAPSAALYVARGHARLASNGLDGAIDDFTAAATLDPTSAAALNNRGLAWRKKGDLARAEADYAAALALNPIYALAYANRGMMREEQGRKAEAIEDLRQALLVDPSLTSARDALKRLGADTALARDSEARVTQGETIVTANCGRCHATGQDGSSPNPKAPEFRNLHRRHPLLALREPLTRGIAAQHDEMPHFTLSTAEIDAIIAYINSIAAAP